MENLDVILIIVAYIVFGFLLPFLYSSWFSSKYGKSAISVGAALLCAVLVVLAAVFNSDPAFGPWGLVFAVAAVVVALFSVFRAVTVAFSASHSIIATLGALLFQLMATAGIAIFVFILFLGHDANGKKKKR